MPSCIAPIEHTRTLCLKPINGLRYGNFEGVVHLPPAVDSHVRLGEHSYSALNNQQIYKTICDWFLAFQPWQQRVLLYGIVDRCSNRHVDVVLTSLEPIRHRDYVTAQRKSYPSTPFRQQKNQMGELHPLNSESSQFIHNLISDSETTVTSSSTWKDPAAETDLVDSFDEDSVLLEVGVNQYAGNLAGEIVKDALEVKLIEELRQSLTLALCPPEGQKNHFSDVCDSEEMSEIQDPVYVQKYAETLALNILKDSVITGLERENRKQKRLCDNFFTSTVSDLKNFQVIEEELFVQKYAETLSEKILDDSMVRSQLFSEREGIVDSFAETLASQVIQIVLQERSDVSAGTDTVDAISCQNEICNLAEQMSQNILQSSVCEIPSLTDIVISERSPHENAQVPQPCLPKEENIPSLSETRPDNTHNITIELTADDLNKPQKPIEMGMLHVIPPIKVTRSENGPNRPSAAASRHSELERSWSRLSRCSTDVVRYSLLGSAALCTPDFFARGRIKKLGPAQCELVKEPVNSPLHLQHVPISLQKACKHVKWWTGIPHQGRVLFRPKKANLLQCFREQINQVWQWMDLWESYEKLTLLKDLLKLCDPDILGALSTYIQQRSHDIRDINRLTDKLLLYILSFLSPLQIRNASQVCRRWRYLCATDELWMIKCHEIGVQEGIDNIDKIVQKSSSQTMGIDWKMAFREVQRLTTVMKMGLSLFSTPVEPIPKTGSKHKASRLLRLSRERTQKTLQGFSREGTRILADIAEGILTDSQILDAISPFITSSFTSPTSKRFRRKKLPALTKPSTKRDMKSNKQEGKRRTTAVTSMKPVIRTRRSSKDEDTTAVDIRQDLIQATDLLGKSTPRVHLQWQKGEENRNSKNEDGPVYRGIVKTVIRVRKLQGHLSSILCLKFDSKRLFTAGGDRTVRVWDVRSSRSVHKLYGHKGGIRCLDFDGYVLVTGSWDTTVMVWDVKMFELITTLTEHSDCVSSIKLGEDHIVSGSYDTTVRVWSRKTLSQWKVIRGHTGPINCLNFDGTYVVSGASDGQARLTNIFTSQCIHVFEGSQNQVLTVMVRGDLVMCGDSVGRIHFWNKKTGDGEAVIQAHSEAVHGISYHRRRFFSVSSDSAIKEWDLVTMTPIRILQGHRGTIRHIQVSDDRIATCGDDGTVRIWDLFDPRQLPQ